MKAFFVNASPRKNGNTFKLLKSAMEGAAAEGAEVQIANIYDKPFKGCVSCFACKVKGSRTAGLCAVRDDMRPILEAAAGADVIVIGSPVYFNGMTAGARAFVERLMFPIDTYLVDADGKRVNVPHKKVATAVIYDMNCPADFMDAVNYRTLLGDIEHELARLFGSSEILYVNDTFQFSDYSRYDVNMFSAEAKKRQLETQFPIDLQNARELGARLVERAREAQK